MQRLIASRVEPMSKDPFCTILLLTLSAALVGSVTVGHCQPRIEYNTGGDDTVSSGCRTVIMSPC
jgi:hypothetical protein